MKKRLTNDRFVKLIEWRRKTAFPHGASPRMVCDSLSGEGLSYDDIPEQFYEDVVAFRHCTQGRRIQIVVAAFALNPRKPLRKPKAKPEVVFAVCGYLSQQCETIAEANEWVEDRLQRTAYPRAFIVKGELTVVEKVTAWPLKRTVMK